jgi:hypothetical protein
VKTTRRDFIHLSAATALSTKLAFATPAANPNLYTTLLQSWCDGLLAHQVIDIANPALHGAFLCPSCAMIHGRCGDAVYPLLRVAHTTGDSRYLRAAIMVHDWSERNVSQADGSWINDVILSSWKGITVFHTIALAEALHHHGAILPAATRQQWTARLTAAAKFLDTFISIETGNINYPITASYAFALCAVVLNEPRYTTRARDLAHAAIDCITPVGLLYGEGHPIQKLSPKHCRPVDLGYNVEESLPALALYATFTNDEIIRDKAIAALRTHLEFMLPDGAWDNSWGTRNYKWSYWGSRTSDGCHPAFAALADHDPRFLEAAHRNLKLMADCTHDNLLYGGPDYHHHGDLPCIHHNFTHAKTLATVLDRGLADPVNAARTPLPRDIAYGLKSFPDIATHLASIGPWRATVTGYDWEYIETVQSGSGGSGGGHATGGALSMLFHQTLGPILIASMTEYSIVEVSNQQQHGDKPHMTLTPRIEIPATPRPFTTLNDLAATLTAESSPDKIAFHAHGQFQTSKHAPSPATYDLTYTLTTTAVEIIAVFNGPSDTPASFILPVISRSTEPFATLTPHTLHIGKSTGTLLIHTDAPFAPLPTDRSFNLVPGFECIPLSVPMRSNAPIHIRLEAN